ncbi:hypothetical protein BDZ89DRAFT_1089945 [Hymenopellis radicata]|nr:hypothetical protein BDZ89DRAFT_1089945 [Hymenopellis radicata]
MSNQPEKPHNVLVLGLGATVTFLLRSPAVFDGNTEIQPFIKSGKAVLVKGDALKQGDVKAAWGAASAHGTIEVVLFTVGGTPTFHLTKGIVLATPNLVTQCLLNLLCTIPSATTPKLVIISSNGLTRTSHKSLPLALKPVYGYLLAAPHEDKIGAERALRYCAGWPWNAKEDGEPTSEIMGENWTEREGLPVPGSLKNVLLIRPALLTDGKCTAEDGNKKPYRVAEGDIAGAYIVSRRDVAHFVVDAVTNKWSKFVDKCVCIAH